MQNQNLNYIDGCWVPSQSGQTLTVDEPATGKTFAEIPRSNAKDVDLAVVAGRRAFKNGWRDTTGAQRAEWLRAIAKGIDAQAEALAELEVRDSGKPIIEARYDMGDAAACFNYYADLAEGLDKQQGEQVKIGDDRFDCSLRYEAAGVVGLIVPWNFPLVNAAWKVAPALAAGCTVVLKPSEMASLTTVKLAEIADKAGLPAGVLNVIFGVGSECGAALASHPGVAKLSFTGSTESGRKVLQGRAGVIGDTALELGGKSAMLVFDDVAVDDAVEWILMGTMYNGGQVCASTSRVFIHENLHDAVMEKLVKAVENMPVGPGMDESTRVGPLVSRVQRDRCARLISEGIEQGAKVLVGGKIPDAHQEGYYYAPTLMVDVSEDNILWKEEVFGPFICVRSFSDEDEAIGWANDTHYGLAASVLTTDLVRAERVTRQMDAGCVWVNCSGPAILEAPWGGVKQSGFGRGLGPWGMHEFLEIKQVTRYGNAEAWTHFSLT